MKMKKVLFSALAVSALIFSCKKDKDEKSNSELIIGKWDLTMTPRILHFNNVTSPDTIRYNSGSHVLDFRTNNKAIITNPNGSGTDTVDYKVDGSKLFFDGDTLNIYKLSTAELQLFQISTYGPNYYYEEWPTFKKIN